MANNEIPLMGDNLQELFTAVHSTEEGKEAELVPNGFGTRVYYARAGWGRFWRVLFAIWGYCINDCLKMRKLKQALQKTKSIFDREKINIAKIFETYQSHLRDKFIEKSDDQKDDQKEFLHARYQVNNWNDNTLPFVRLMEKGGNSKIKKIFTDAFSTDQTENEPSPPFIHNECLSTMAQFQSIIDVERILEFPLPYAIIKKMSLRLKLVSEEKEIENFVSLLNEKSKELSLNVLRKAFNVLVKFIETDIINAKLQKPDVNWIGMELAYRNCSIFALPEPKHAQWRASLKSGVTVSCNGKDYVLGEMLGKPKKVDKRHVYRIVDNPDAVIVIGCNKIILGVQSLMSKYLSWGIYPANSIDVDDKGMSAVVEYLPHALNTAAWTTKNTLTEEDKKYAKPFIEQVKWNLMMGATPLNFNTKNLRYNKDGILKSFKIPLKSPILDFTEAENFIYECSNGQSLIFKYIMTESGFYDHKYAKYYQEITENAIDDEDVGAENVAVFSRHQVVEPNIISRAKVLYKEVEETKRKILKHILENYDITDIQDVGGWVQESMKKVFKQAGTVSTIWPQYDQYVISMIEKKNGIEKKTYRTSMANLV